MSERATQETRSLEERRDRSYKEIAPSTVGLAIAYFGLSASASGGFCGISSSALSDGAQAAAIVPALVLAAILRGKGGSLSERAWKIALLVSVAVEAAGLLVLGMAQITGTCTALPRFVISAVVAGATIVACAFWLRRAQGAGAVTAAVLVFSAMAVSEVILFAVEFAPERFVCAIAAPVVLTQIPCALWARKAGLPKEGVDQPDDFYAFMHTGAANRRFLAVSAIGLGAIALVAGFLCALPSDALIPRTPEFRGLKLALVIIVCAAFIASVVRRRSRTMTVGVWVAMELLAASSLTLFSAMPDSPEISALASTLLVTVMTAFVWHLIIAFLTPGKLDALFYTIVVWAICIVPHEVGRLAVSALPVHGESHLTGTIVSLLLLISTQIVLVKLLDVARFAAQHKTPTAETRQTGEDGEDGRANEAEETAGSALERLLGIDEESAVTDVSRAAMQHCAERMGQHFLLSGREVEVLALWAAGYTQKRVAEKLHVSPTTAHTHITRIYAKTGLHSRQEVLDFMHRYLDE